MILDFLRRILTEVQTAIDDGYYRDFARRNTRPDDVPSLEAAIRRDAPWGFLAEAKPRSPTQKKAAANDPKRLISTYRDYQVTGISVLTERETFGGSLELMAEAARGAAAPITARAPVLMKDFVVHEDQLAAAHAGGASAVLLLYRLIQRGATEWEHPDDAIAAAHRHGLEVLFEVDDPHAFEDAAASKAEILGVNNRDLSTLEMDPNRTIDILRHRLHLVSDRPVLSLSGIENRADVLANQQGAATGVLVGTALMHAADVRATLRSLRGMAHVKCCGSGHPQDDDDAIHALCAADAVGVVVETDAPRQRSVEEARALFDRLPKDVERVLVTTQQDLERLPALMEETHATHLQWHRETQPDELKQLRGALAPETGLIALLRLPRKEEAEGDLTMLIETAKGLSRHADRILLDARPKPGDAPGGTGHETDLKTAAALVHALKPYPVVLAGGLNGDNVARALRQVRPWGVDTSSGTEDPGQTGRKNPERVFHYLSQARRVLNLDEAKDPAEVDRLRVL